TFSLSPCLPVSLSGGAAVEDPGDVGVVHEGERLAFRLKAGDDLSRVHSRLEHLERHQAPDRSLLLGQIDVAEASLADLLQQFVWPKRAFGPPVRRLGTLTGCAAKEMAGVSMCRQKGLHARTERGVGGTRRVEVAGQVARRFMVEGLKENGFR